MNVTQQLFDLVAVVLVAALAPLVVAVLPGPRVPQVVIFLVGGILIGPHVLGLADASDIQLLANIGLGFLFLLAGYELDPHLLREEPGRLAMTGWVISAILAVGVAGALTAAGYINDYVPVGLALTTTALGTLLPILRDSGMLAGRFGRDVYAAGAVGELFPILIIAVFLTNRGHFVALASVAAVGLLAIVLSVVPWLAHSRAVRRIIREGQDATGQITLRWAVVLLFLLIAVASKFGLDIVLGAVLAGMVVRIWVRRLSMDTASLERKFDAVGYGIFIPIFFVSSGMSIDLKAIGQDPLRLLLFLAMLLIVRGLPSLIVYRRVLPVRQRAEMTFITATSLPLLIALAEIGQQDGVMLPATAAALVGAGVLSVLIFPLVAVGLHRSAPLTPSDVGIQSDPAPEETPRSVPDNGQLPGAAGKRRSPADARRIMSSGEVTTSDGVRLHYVEAGTGQDLRVDREPGRGHPGRSRPDRLGRRPGQPPGVLGKPLRRQRRDPGVLRLNGLTGRGVITVRAVRLESRLMARDSDDDLAVGVGEDGVGVFSPRTDVARGPLQGGLVAHSGSLGELDEAGGGQPLGPAAGNFSGRLEARIRPDGSGHGEVMQACLAGHPHQLTADRQVLSFRSPHSDEGTLPGLPSGARRVPPCCPVVAFPVGDQPAGPGDPCQRLQ